MHWVFILAGSVPVFVILGFGITSFREKEKRAGWVALLLAGGFATAWFITGGLLPTMTFLLAAIFSMVALVLTVILLLPFGNASPLMIDDTQTERYDERDVIFSRMAIAAGQTPYETYYQRMRPDLKRFDDYLRTLPALAEPGSECYDPLDAPYFGAVFKYIQKFNLLADPGDPVGDRVDISPQEATRRVKGFAKHLGALDVRVTKLKDYHVYSHVGRRLEAWGQEIPIQHSHTVVLSIEMDNDMIRCAPLSPGVTESAACYMKIANIAISVATYITEIGYHARAHVDGNYHILNTALAHEAGIGELGRIGLIVTPTHGPRIRLAAVTTDLPLLEDQPIHFGVQHFCEICKKCADNCPSGSISKGEKKTVRGVTKWESNMESCYQFWLKNGTDCALCIAVCPYSKPNTFYHRIVRFFNTRNALARRIALWMDDLFYSRRPRHTRKPGWFTKVIP